MRKMCLLAVAAMFISSNCEAGLFSRFFNRGSSCSSCRSCQKPSPSCYKNQKGEMVCPVKKK